MKKNIKLNNEEEDDSGSSELNFRDSTGSFYIHGIINDSMPKNIISPLLQEIEKRSKSIDKEPIRIFITSPGGNLYPCFDIISLFDYAKIKKVPIHTYVTSYCASAGSLIAVCGHVRFVSQRSYHLLHYARIWNFSHNPEMSDRNHDNEKWMQDELVKIYAEHTKIPSKDLKQKLLTDNFIINGGKNLIKFGLADKLFDE